MSFWEKIKQSLRNFMSGRNGADRLGLTLFMDRPDPVYSGYADRNGFRHVLAAAGFASESGRFRLLHSVHFPHVQPEPAQAAGGKPPVRSLIRPLQDPVASGEEPFQKPQAVQILPLPQLQGVAPSAPGQGGRDRHLQPLPHQLYTKILMAFAAA